MRKAQKLLQNFPPAPNADNEHPEMQRVFAEWRQDHSMARERLETGKEPSARPVEVQRASARTKPAGQIKERSKGIDIPF